VEAFKNELNLDEQKVRHRNYSPSDFIDPGNNIYYCNKKKAMLCLLIAVVC